MIEDHRFPFSLVSQSKHGHSDIFSKQGDVSEHMDKSIGRPVYRIKGSVSANNYIQFDHIALIGPIIHIQMCLLKPIISTIHLEVVTSSGVSLRLSASTMYCGDKPRFLGRSLRLPLPHQAGWIVVVMDLNVILSRYCGGVTLATIKKIQLCSNMLLRDVVTSDKVLSSDPKLAPKELAVKPRAASDPEMVYVNLVDFCEDVSQASGSGSAPTGGEEARALKTKQLLQDGSPPPQIPPRVDAILRPQHWGDATSPAVGEMPNLVNNVLTTQDLATPGNLFTRSDIAISRTATPSTIVADKRLLFASLRTDGLVQGESKSPASLRTPLAPAARMSGTGVLPSSIVRYCVPETAPVDRLLSLQKLLGYDGGPAVLLYEGRMLLLATGALLVLLDLECKTSAPPSSGLWKAFSGSVERWGENDGYRQAVLRGHGLPVGLIEISEKETLMVTVETSASEATTPALIVWDLIEGKRLATLRPHTHSIISAGFSLDNSLLVTAGTDAQRRFQIVIWDVQQLVSTKMTAIDQQASSTLAVARQISEFPISHIAFSPFESFSLVSCGRENIRFWRIRKGHLPGRPVLLNEFSRGFEFNHLAFHNDVDGPDHLARRPTVYVSSNKGMLLRVSCLGQVLCAFQLHSAPIRSLCIRFGYAVTGADDHRLRVWPMDFSDFLLEAQHEGPVTSVRISADGRTQAIGTSAGTLGVLNVSDHSYNTVLRAHVGAVIHIAKRGEDWCEVATIGAADHTVRVWDVISGSQVTEFSCERDQPSCLCYHPTDHLLVCGFHSGCVRVFDVETAVVIHSKKLHASAVTSVLFVTPEGGQLLLVSVGVDGQLVASTLSRGLEQMKAVQFSTNATAVASLAASADGSLVAVAGSTTASIAVLETREFTTVMRVSPQLPVGDADVPSSTVVVTDPSTGESFAPLSSVSMSASRGSPSAHKQSTATPTINSLASTVVGMSFLRSERGHELLVTTDNHFMCLSVHSAHETTGGRKVPRRRSAWEERVTRRIDFGAPTCCVRDDATGLMLVALRPPVVGSGKQRKGEDASLNKLSDSANAFAVLSVCLSDDRLSVSGTQVYRSLPGVVRGLCPYFSCGKVVTVDESGCIVFWDIKSHNLAVIAAAPEAPVSRRLALLDEDVGTPGALMAAEAEKEDAQVVTMSNNASPSETRWGNSLYAVDNEQQSNHELTTPTAAKLTRAFEQAVLHDPAMWSQTSAGSCSGRDEGDGDHHSALLSAHEWEENTPGPGAAANDGYVSVQQTEGRKEEPVASADLNVVEPRADRSQVLLKTAQSAKPTKAGTSIVQSAEPVGMCSNAVVGLAEWQRFLALGGDCHLDHASGTKVVLSHRNAVAPCVDQQSGLVVVSDGASIVAKQQCGTASHHAFMPVPEYLAKYDQCSVLALSLEPSSAAIAAVVRVVSPDEKSVAHCLLVWTHTSLQSVGCGWSLAGHADLSISEQANDNSVLLPAHHRLLMAWTDDHLVIAAARSQQGSRTSESVKLVAISSEDLLAGRVVEALAAGSFSAHCPVSGGLSALKVMPSRRSDALSVLISSRSKLFHLAIHKHNACAEVLWSDDMGSKGPVVALDVTVCGRGLLSTPATAARKATGPVLVRRVSAALDSSGAVRFAEFFWSDSAEKPPSPRCVTVSIAAAHISGALHSLALSPPDMNVLGPHSELTMVLGASHNVRLFSVQIRDLGAKTIAANVTLIAKVALDCSPDHFLFLRPSTDHCTSIVASNAAGTFSLLRFSRKPGHVSETFDFQTAPLPHTSENTAMAMAVFAECSVLATLSGSGQLLLNHIDSGIRLSCHDSFCPLRGVCLQKAWASLLAVGTSCGKVVLVSMRDAQIAHIVNVGRGSAVQDGSSVAAVASSVTSLRGSTDARRMETKSHLLGGRAVVGLVAVAKGSALLALQEDSQVSILQLYPGPEQAPFTAIITPSFDLSGPQSVAVALLNADQRRTILATCHGDDQMCAVVRQGSNVLELHRTDHNETALSDLIDSDPFGASRLRRSFWVNVLNLSLKVVSASASSNLHISACHLIFQGRSLLISVVGVPEGQNEPGLFVGTVLMPQHASSMSRDAPLRVALSPRSAFTETPSAVRFDGRFCIIVQPSIVEAWNLFGESPEAPDSCALRLVAQSMAFGKAGNFSHSVTALDGEWIYFYRNDSPLLAKFALRHE